MGEVKDVAAALGRALNEVKKYLLLRQYRMHKLKMIAFLACIYSHCYYLTYKVR